MVTQTPVHGLNKYSAGEDGWSHADTVDLVDELLTSRGLFADRPTSGAYQDQFYYATDHGVLYRWDDDASTWTIAGGLGSSDQALPPLWSEALRLADTTTAPSNDGEFRLNGTTVEVQTDGEVQSLSDVGHDVVAEGTATLAGGLFTISTGVTETPAYLNVYVDPSGGGSNAQDVKVAARAFWDDSAGEHKVELVEDGTDVGNPDVGYRVVRA